jgi:predicted transcriptional regulator of viral defense system
MKYIELKDRLKDLTVLSIKDIEKSAGSRFYRRRLNEWQDKNYIKKLIKGYYIFSDLKVDENIFFEIANRIYSPSYVSLESALSHYGLIPEGVFSVTSVSPRKTAAFNTPLASFSYRKIKTSLFFGYILEKYDSKVYRIASPEKALLDYFYLKAGINKKYDFDSLRFNPENYKQEIDKGRLFDYLGFYNNRRLENAVRAFQEYMNNA